MNVLQCVAARGAHIITGCQRRDSQRLQARCHDPPVTRAPNPRGHLQAGECKAILTKKSGCSFHTCFGLASVVAGTMRPWAALHQHCGRLSARHACAVMRGPHISAAAGHHAWQQPRFQHSIHLQPASVHAPASPQRYSVQRRSRSGAVSAMGTDARSSKPQEQQQTSQADHQQQGSSAAPSWDIKMLYDGDCPLCMREVRGLASQACPVGWSPEPGMLARRIVHTTWHGYAWVGTSTSASA